jgi:hypothetical protein
MPIVGQTKVLPELLDETYRRLRPWMAQRDGRPRGQPTDRQ